jgi:hypothetical protein
LEKIETMNDSRLLKLDPHDNVFVTIRTIAVGDSLVIDGRGVEVSKEIPLGYKVAARDIAAGEKILKYRAHIGSATRAIAAGEIVHLHNMKSDYLPTFTRDEGMKYGGH